MSFVAIVGAQTQVCLNGLVYIKNNHILQLNMHIISRFITLSTFEYIVQHVTAMLFIDWSDWVEKSYGHARIWENHTRHFIFREKKIELSVNDEHWKLKKMYCRSASAVKSSPTFDNHYLKYGYCSHTNIVNYGEPICVVFWNVDSYVYALH